MYLFKYIEQMGTGTLEMIERCVSAGLREPEFEASGEFVTRIWRAALAGQPVVFTGRTGFDAVTGEKTGEKAGPIKMRQFIFTHTSGPVPRHAVLGVGGVQ